MYFLMKDTPADAANILAHSVSIGMKPSTGVTRTQAAPKQANISAIGSDLVLYMFYGDSWCGHSIVTPRSGAL